MTAVDVDALDKLREAATAGPWRVGRSDATGTALLDDDGDFCGSAGLRADAALIVAAVNALPDLIAEVRRGRALREAVEGLAEGAASAGDLPVLKGDRFDAGVAATYRSYADRLRELLAAVDAS